MAVESLREQLSSFKVEGVVGLDDPNKRIEGSGSFGTVLEVLVDGVPRIAKQLHKSLLAPDTDPSGKEKLFERFQKECLLLSRLDHPNIVKFTGVHFDSNQGLSLIMEKLDTDLEKYLGEHPNVPIVQKLSILLDVSTGILYLHSQDPPIIHRDLKMENILLTTDLKAKIADFGVSRVLNISPTRLASLTQCPGSMAYMPPEALQEHPAYGKALDIFSFGEVCLCTIHQKFAEFFSVTNDPDMPAAFQRGEIEILKRKKWFDTIPPDHNCLRNIVRLCLKDQSSKRPSTLQLKEMIKKVYLAEKQKQEAVTKTDTGASAGGLEVKSKIAAPTATSKKAEIKKEEEKFPDTLEGFGYHFVDGQLRNIETGEEFVFEVRKGDKEYNQRHYEALGEAITKHIYKLLVERAGLKRVNIPIRATEDCSFFFMSEDALTAGKLMVLIHGSGEERAGQWARSLIINDCLESGTQLPYIERAKREGYGVIVTNTNENGRLVKGKPKQYKDSRTPEEHAFYVWREFVKRAKAQHIDIVAHSNGGAVTVNLLNEFFNDFKKRVKKIAFTDSVHSARKGPQQKMTWLAKHATNWVSSDTPLDTELVSWVDHGVRRLSAGTQKHVETTHKSYESVFRYLMDSEEQ